MKPEFIALHNQTELLRRAVRRGQVPYGLLFITLVIIRFGEWVMLHEK